MQKTKKHSRVLQFFRFQNKKTKKSQGKPKKANLSSRPKVLLKVFVFLFFFWFCHTQCIQYVQSRLVLKIQDYLTESMCILTCTCIIEKVKSKYKYMVTPPLEPTSKHVFILKRCFRGGGHLYIKPKNPKTQNGTDHGMISGEPIRTDMVCAILGGKPKNPKTQNCTPPKKI